MGQVPTVSSTECRRRAQSRAPESDEGGEREQVPGMGICGWER
jgi:hypothetical protein